MVTGCDRVWELTNPLWMIVILDQMVFTQLEEVHSWKFMMPMSEAVLSARTLNRRRYKNPRPHKREEEGRGIRHPGDYT
jgi:hypothetical protein